MVATFHQLKTFLLFIALVGWSSCSSDSPSSSDVPVSTDPPSSSVAAAGTAEVHALSFNSDYSQFDVQIDATSFTCGMFNSLHVSHTGQLNGLFLQLGEELVNFNAGTQQITPIADHWKVYKNDAGKLEKLKNKTRGWEYKFYYEGDKLVGIKDKKTDIKVKFKYEGDLVSKVKLGEADCFKLNYDGNKLAKIKKGEDEELLKFVYDGNVLAKFKTAAGEWKFQYDGSTLKNIGTGEGQLCSIADGGCKDLPFALKTK